MSVIETFDKLREQVEKADNSIKAVADRNQAEIEVKLDEARQEADSRAAELPSTTGDKAGDGESRWRTMQSEWKHHVERIHERADAKKAEIDSDMAEDDADWAETEALDAIAFAGSAIIEAEYATLDAILARKKAQLTASSS